MKKHFYFLSFLVWMFMDLTAQAQQQPWHFTYPNMLAMDVMYRHVSDSTYDVYYKVYRNCTTAVDPQTYITGGGQLQWNTTPGLTCIASGATMSMMVTQPTSLCGNGGALPQQISTGCPTGSAYATNCTNPTSIIPGVREEWFTAREQFYPYSVNGKANMSPYGIYRDTNVYNVSGTNGPIYVSPSYATRWTYPYLFLNLNNAGGRINNSPCFTSKPVPYVCTGSPFTYNMGAIDPDGDSLRYELMMPVNAGGGEQCLHSTVSGTSMGYCGCPMVFTSPTYNLTNNPFATNNTFSLNPATGQISFTSARDGMATIAIKVSEYRGGVLIGTSMREMNIISLPCSAPQPSLAPETNTFGAATQYTGGRFEGCAGKPLSFCANIRSATPTAQLVVRDNSALATSGAAVSYANALSDSVRLCYNWTPAAGDTGLHNLVFTVKDSVCTPPGFPITHSLTLPVYIHPATTAAPDTAICEGASVRLSAVGGGGFVWSVLPGGAPLSSLSCTACANPIATPAVTTRYVVTSARASFCNQGKDTVTITVAERPRYHLPHDTTACSGAVALPLTVQPAVATAFSYRWTPATGLSSDTLQRPLATPATDTTYYLTITPGGLAACAVHDSIRVRVAGALTLLNNGVSGCIGQPYTVQATAQDSRYRYRWTVLPTAAGAISNDTVLTPTLTPLTDTGVYVLQALFPGCPLRTDTLRFFAEPVPTIAFAGDTTLCAKDTLRLQPSITPANGPYSYQWSVPAGSRLSAATSASPLLIAGGMGGQVSLTASTPNARCSATQSFNLTVRPVGFLSVAPADTVICPGDAALLRAAGSGITALRWQPAATLSDTTGMTVTARPQVSTRYAAIAANSEGCRDTAWATVTVQSLSLNLPDTIFVRIGDTTRLSPRPAERVVGGYLWSPDRWISNINTDEPLVWPQQSLYYEVGARLESGCWVSGRVYVQVSDGDRLPVPSAFAPAAEPGGFKVARWGGYKLVRFSVYNRWGNRLFDTADPAKGWDGAYDGNAQPEGAYIYLLETLTPAGKPYLQKGSVVLVR